LVTMEPSPVAYKKATAMLDEAARARLRGPFVSDTAPSPAPSGLADADDELVDLVDEFYNGYDQHGTDAAVVAKAPRAAEWKETLRAALADAAADVAAARIRTEAERVVRDAPPGNTGGVGVKKRLVERLRARGFNAGLCRSSWEKSSSVPAPGAHEYVDVTTGPSASSPRYIVEVNVASEFDIARPSAEYRDLLRALPPVLVATPEAFERVAAAMCAAAADSIRRAGMHLAPWRRAQYVQAKWSSQYERVVGLTPVAKAEKREEIVTPVATARSAVAMAPVAMSGARPAGQEIGARAVVRALRPGGRKNCGMEMGCRELAMGREALISVRPLFQGM
ncbi:hypothetical protein EJB05_19794, partial [Eragrostis curvula]